MNNSGGKFGSQDDEEMKNETMDVPFGDQANTDFQSALEQITP